MPTNRIGHSVPEVEMSFAHAEGDLATGRDETAALEERIEALTILWLKRLNSARRSTTNSLP